VRRGGVGGAAGGMNDYRTVTWTLGMTKRTPQRMPQPHSGEQSSATRDNEEWTADALSKEAVANSSHSWL
jgi:hypothetical protein